LPADVDQPDRQSLRAKRVNVLFDEGFIHVMPPRTFRRAGPRTPGRA
jgi:hypothetical protein